MRVRLLAATALLPALAASPAPAQRSAALPDRPIARREVVAGVRRQFAAMDTNRDGAVSRAEFDTYRARTAGAAAGGADPFAHVGSHWLDRADVDGDGRVTIAEAETRPLELFDMADADHDGVISAGERQAAMMMMALRGK